MGIPAEWVEVFSATLNASIHVAFKGPPHYVRCTGCAGRSPTLISNGGYPTRSASPVWNDSGIRGWGDQKLKIIWISCSRNRRVMLSLQACVCVLHKTPISAQTHSRALSMPLPVPLSTCRWALLKNKGHGQHHALATQPGSFQSIGTAELHSPLPFDSTLWSSRTF